MYIVPAITDGDRTSTPITAAIARFAGGAVAGSRAHGDRQPGVTAPDDGGGGRTEGAGGSGEEGARRPLAQGQEQQGWRLRTGAQPSAGWLLAAMGD